MAAFEMVQFSSKIDRLALTLTRNFGAAFLWTHIGACTLFFIARQQYFEDTWLAPEPTDSIYDLYVTSLYWSVVTFATVGYGDFSPSNSAEMIFDIVFMFINMVFGAWIIGSITLLVVKNDEKNGKYRENLKLLDEYVSMNNLDDDLRRGLKNQLKLDFNSREVSEENVLQHYPYALRRKVLRKVYLPVLQQTDLMRGMRQLFLDAFLTSCTVELFGPGVELIQRGRISNDLYLLVHGVVKDFTSNNIDTEHWEEKQAGDFINDIGFFTESPNISTVHTVGICKILTMPKLVYKAIADEHPSSASMVLKNLLVKAKKMSSVELPKPMSVLRAGSAYDMDPSSSLAHKAMIKTQFQAAVTSVEELVAMHVHKLDDDHTTRFLFAASRSDIPTLSLMLDKGMDPNSVDYDGRTALMVAAMNGNAEAVTILLDKQADPNMVDGHNNTALYEAVKGSHDECIEVLLKNKAELLMSDETAASLLCKSVFDSDIKLLSRLCAWLASMSMLLTMICEQHFMWLPVKATWLQ
jgi:potassium channel